MSRAPYLCTLILASACTESVQTATVRAQIITSTTTGGVEVVEPIDPVDACPDDRQVGFLPPGVLDCPAPLGSASGSWSQERLFGSGRPAELAAYCLYRWNGNAAPDLAALPPAGGVPAPDWMDPDCRVVVPIAAPNAYETLAAPALQSAFLDQVEALQFLPGEGHPEPTKVVVVDASPTAGFPDPTPGFIEHGFLVGQIVRRLGCPTPGACLTQVSSQLAMNLRQLSGGWIEANEEGGSFGYQSELALAILQGYEAAAASSPSRRIIINLSVGWDPKTGGGDYVGVNWKGQPNPAKAVHTAITKVACEGALVIAAAGNDSGGPSADGPMYPGGWEQKAAPDATRCAGGLGGGGLAVSGSPYRPLLHAVGGVDGQDKPLAVGRALGMPPLVAPSDHVTLEYRQGAATNFTGVYSGTSMSAAVASGIAGAVWAYRPTLSPADVMQVLRNAAVTLPGPVDFCGPGAPCPMNQRRLSLCRSVAAACGPSPHCGVAPVCGSPNPGRDARATGILWSGITATEFNGATAHHSNPSPWPCSGDFLSVAPPGPADGMWCPVRQFYANESAPWVYPQPLVHPCPTCALDIYALYIGISNEAPLDMSYPQLILLTETGDKKTIELDLGEDLKPGATLKVTGLGFTSEDLKLIDKASFDVRVGDKFTVSSPVLIDP